MPKLSIVIPCYNVEDNIPVTSKVIFDCEKLYPGDVEFEYIFVDDGSKDKTLKALKAGQPITSKDKFQIKFASFWRWSIVAVGAMLLWAGYLSWSPGLKVQGGRHDLGRNGIWLQHGWLGANEWFVRYDKLDRIQTFRDRQYIDRFASLLARHHITDVFPHVAPTRPNGRLPPVDQAQMERFLDGFGSFRVMPWIGGVMGKTVWIADKQWRQEFVSSAAKLLAQHPRLAGIHLNI